MNVTPFPMRMTAKQAEATVRRIAEDSSKIRFTDHAQERMDERSITLQDVHRVLKKGYIQELPKQGRKDGEWAVKVVRHARGNRDIGVATVIVRQDYLIIATVEWEDL